MIKNKFLLLRRQRGLTLEEASSSIGVAPSSLKQWEQGNRFPAMKSLKKIAEFYQVELTFFADEVPVIPPEPVITIETLSTMDGEPIWYNGTQKWYLIDAAAEHIIDVKGETLPFTELDELQLEIRQIENKAKPIEPLRKEPVIDNEKALKRREVLASKQVFVIPIYSDERVVKQLQGIYDVDVVKECVYHNDIKFLLRYMGKQWVAYPVETIE